MPTYKLTIEYEGTRYSGWQAQSNTAKTVQGRLVEAAAQFLKTVEIGGAGRTDAGVHAAAQVAHLRTPQAAPPIDILRKLNDLLPHDIHVLRVEHAQDGFHARHDAELRVYLYQISRRRSAFAKPFIWWIKDRLGVAAMREASAALAGMHDFTALSDKRIEESTKVKVEAVALEEAGDLLLFRIAASHFLWKMVRKIVAALVEVGRGTMSPADFAKLVDDPNARFQPSAPPSGLFLEAIVYPGETFDRPLAPIVPVVTPRVRSRSVESAATPRVREKKRR